ncbi:TrbG/VirB9 family P-type conjugative transfer protein [Azospirillum thermophilum]|uniref:Conjugal transfer protein TrbG n=1 Tax=Azospirillum thermophilum TaxID=2202148 RepID=A0A2S2CND5_9PROT|nr:TrbG/VirB9 family P-type conjugative transfer protein [Azospirillum thermophilum]AWK86002.1 conjugal transfer protein TrbG [Azospirillum thermophilum]
MRVPVPLLALPLLAACATDGTPSDLAAEVPAPRTYTMADLRIPRTQMEEERREKPAPRPSRAQTRSWVGQANEAALDLPTLTCFKGKSCEYWYQSDLQYLVYMAEGNQTLVCLKPGEVVRDIVAPGAQVWIPHQPYSFGKGAQRTECIAFMPRRAGLNHQISIFTSERKYDLNVETHKRTHHVEVRWRYPEDYLATLNGQPVNVPATDRRDRTTELAYRDRRCTYTLDGDTPEWRPVPTADGQPPVCDDGEVTVINFTPGALGANGAPVLWRIGADATRIPVQYGRMNATYRVAGIHDHLLLALGAQEVHIRRTRP